MCVLIEWLGFEPFRLQKILILARYVVVGCIMAYPILLEIKDCQVNFVFQALISIQYSPSGRRHWGRL